MPDDPQLDVLIADDEKEIREHLSELAGQRPEVRSVTEATDGREAVTLIEEEEVDLVFLDVKMPGSSGLEVVEEIGLGHIPPTIFVTAYEEHAKRAFDLGAVDYLLKPFEERRFAIAFERALGVVTMEEVEKLAAQFGETRTMSDAARRASESNPAINQQSNSNGREEAKDKYLKRLTVESNDQIHVIPVDDIEYITAEGVYVEIHTDSDSRLLRERLYEVEEWLDPTEFARIHRSTIVRLDCVESLRRRSSGDYLVELVNDERLRVSRSRQDQLLRQLKTGSPG